MSVQNKVDILEEDIISYSSELLKILLKDRTTNKNIIWATNDYVELGDMYLAKSEIAFSAISGSNTKVIQPRIDKHLSKQTNRTREKAEVFTPSWICNEQNNLIDEQWFGSKDAFNIAKDKSWKATVSKINFSNIKGRTWKDYVDANRLEITCGEAPYLVSRYDTVTGKHIKIEKRIGLLDRKLRVVNENSTDEKEWFKWVQRAYQSIYGYEYQGDSLLIARENLLYTFIDNKVYKFGIKPSVEEMKRIATIISWNIWQMDGLSNTTPLGAMPENNVQLTLFEEPEKQPEASYCKIKDWRSKKILEFNSLLQKG